MKIIIIFVSHLFLCCSLALSGEGTDRSHHPVRPDEVFRADVYVSPAGNDQAEGTKEQPFATIERALRGLARDRDAVIGLFGGSYSEEVVVPIAEESAFRVTIAGLPGEVAVFQGGRELADWQSFQGEPGLYLIDVRDRSSVHDAPEYFEIWENTHRIRYRKVFDADAVRAWPGSVCPMGDDRLLFHARDQRDPGALSLWRNVRAEGIRIDRPNVTLRNLHFENYLGGMNARAVTVSETAQHVVIEDCTFVNCVQGIVNAGDHTVVKNCRLREVGRGIHCVQKAADLVVAHCVIEAASGLFKVSDLAPHGRSAIRVYHPADGATVEECVTAGFWGGLDIKTGSAGPRARPYRIRNNTFLDGIRSGTSPQPRSCYMANIIGPPKGDLDRTGANGAFLDKLGATLESNYFYGMPGNASGTNIAGIEPFVDAAAGDLRLKSGVMLSGNEPGSSLRKVEWTDEVSAGLRAEKSEIPDLAFLGEPSVASSRRGAIVTAEFTAPVQTAVVRYREVNGTRWRTAKGHDNSVLAEEGSPGAALEGDAQRKYCYLFPLVSGELESEAKYEFQVEAVGRDERKVTSAPGFFDVSGAPKEVRVTPGSKLQNALDRALPGDTVVLEKGLYTEPLILTHGGSAEAPLTIRGEGEMKTILDGGRVAENMVTLRKADYVILRDLQIRWFGSRGIQVEKSSHGRLEGCRILNQYFFEKSGGKSGHGLTLFESPDWVICKSTFTGLEYGVVVQQSPRLTFENNTAFDNVFAGLYLMNSSRDSRITLNTLNFTGNQAMRIYESDPGAIASLVCDFNNYGGLVYPSKDLRPENDFSPSVRYGHLGKYKGIVETTLDGKSTRYLRMEDWRAASGKDASSLFADPEFADPRKGDFRLLSHSPNLLKGGRIIGAGPMVRGLKEEGVHAQQ